MRIATAVGLLAATLVVSLASDPGSSQPGDEGSGSGPGNAGAAEGVSEGCRALERRVAALEERAEDLRAYMAEYREEVTPLDLVKHELLRMAARWPWVRRLREAFGGAP